MGNGPGSIVDLDLKKDIAFDVSGNKYLVFERAADFFPGWRLIYLLDERQILNMVHKPILQVAGPFIVMILIIIAVLVYVLAHVAQKELRERENIEKKTQGKRRKIPVYL